MGKYIQRIRIQYNFFLRILQNLLHQKPRGMGIRQTRTDQNRIRPFHTGRQLFGRFLFRIVNRQKRFRKLRQKNVAVDARRKNPHQADAAVICRFCGEISRSRHSAAPCNHKYVSVTAFMGICRPLRKQAHRAVSLQISPSWLYTAQTFLINADIGKNKLPGIRCARIQKLADLGKTKRNRKVCTKRRIPDVSGIR
ncbi:hypothetical protein IMSAGC012_02175 [Lachnospiraceae bacterium]|nr:hypothetical protein IMSAGC012_02175 [Lachnospiraceae bacterium]